MTSGHRNPLRSEEGGLISHTVEIRSADGVMLRADVVGPPLGTPVVLLHGGGQTRFAWKNSQDALAGEGFYVMSVDLRGHGDSGWSSKQSYSLDDFRDDVVALANHMPSPPILVGASLGGISCALALGEIPTLRARGLALVDVSSHMEAAGNQAILDFMSGTINGFDDLEEAADAVSDYLPHRPRPKETSGLMKNLRLRPDGRYYWHWDPASFSFVDSETLNRRMDAAADNIDTPAILLRGEHSELVSRKAADDYVRRMPNAHVVDIGQARHMVAGDKNDLFTAALLQFCQSLSD